MMIDDEAAPSDQRATMMQVRWDSGHEMIDLGAILRMTAAIVDVGITTTELRGDGGLVIYSPVLQKHNDGGFTLIYSDGGRWRDGGEADGEIGAARYTPPGATDGKEWTCAWTRGNRKTVLARPACSVADVDVARAVAISLRKERDGRFRREVLAISPCCAITGETNPLVLDAAHVLPVSQNGSDQVNNGIVLRRDLHALFDANILRITEEGRFTMADPVLKSYNSYQGQFAKPRGLSAEQVDFVRANIVARNALIA